MMVQHETSYGGTVKEWNTRWWNSTSFDGGILKDLMMGKWNRDGGTVVHLMVEQWNRDGRTVEHLMVEQ